MHAISTANGSEERAHTRVHSKTHAPAFNEELELLVRLHRVANTLRSGGYRPYNRPLAGLLVYV